MQHFNYLIFELQLLIAETSDSSGIYAEDWDHIKVLGLPQTFKL